jgi:hypothetical protein
MLSLSKHLFNFTCIWHSSLSASWRMSGPDYSLSASRAVTLSILIALFMPRLNPPLEGWIQGLLLFHKSLPRGRGLERADTWLLSFVLIDFQLVPFILSLCYYLVPFLLNTLAFLTLFVTICHPLSSFGAFFKKNICHAEPVEASSISHS